MKASLSWLKEFVNIESQVSQIADALTMRGLEIEGVSKDLKDIVFEIGITPNRPDCLSIIGIAREIASIEKKKIKYPEIKLPYLKGQISNFTSVSIEAPLHCPRYCASLIFDIKVADSPFWLKDRLLSIGIRPINNIVDITNLVMIEMGQPLHAFDFDRLSQNRIVVKTANKGDKFITLDQKERELDSEMLMICDGEKPIAIAGVMGGFNSEIESSTKRVLLESAYFDSFSIRRTSKKVLLSTEASYRFERGIDIDGVPKALLRAASLISEIAGGNIVDGIIDEYPNLIQKKSIILSIRETNNLLGTNLDQNKIKNDLESIDFSTEIIDEDKLTVIPPSFRVDVSRPQDLMEEAARISGYENIPTTFPKSYSSTGMLSKKLILRNKIKQLMTGFGFNEAINYSFIHKSFCDDLRLSDNDEKRNIINVLNPINEEMALMRTSLIPGLLNTVKLNISWQVKNIKIFEIGKIFFNQGINNCAKEFEVLTVVWSGLRTEIGWHSKAVECDFYDIKGILENLLYALNLRDINFLKLESKNCDYLKYGYCAKILLDGHSIGRIGELHPITQKNFELKQPCYIFELTLDDIIDKIKDFRQAKSFSKFPSTSRDITLIIDNHLEVSEILKRINDRGENLVENILLFDIYKGNPIPCDKKSISIRITYRSSVETLEDSRINNIHEEISKILVSDFKASLP